MTSSDDNGRIDSLSSLVKRYARHETTDEVRADAPDALTPAMREWLAHAPFLIVASAADDGIDCSPRGDAPGRAFRVLDARRIAIPDRRGNGRLDTLRNLVEDPRVGLLFLVPGAEQVLRVRGRAMISTEPELLASLALDDERPASAIVVTIEAVRAQNFRAVRSAALWSDAARRDPEKLPDIRAPRRGS